MNSALLTLTVYLLLDSLQHLPSTFHPRRIHFDAGSRSVQPSIFYPKLACFDSYLHFDNTALFTLDGYIFTHLRRSND